MLTIKYHASFKRDYKLIKKRGYDIRLLTGVLELLQAGDPLPERYRDHPLTGNWKGCRECHIAPRRTGSWCTRSASGSLFYT